MPSPSRSMARRSWAMCWPKSRVVVLVVLRSFVGVLLIVYGRITRQREKNHRKSDIKSDRVPCSAMCAYQICSFLRFLFESAPKHLQVRMASVCDSSSTCAEAYGWANPSIFTFGKFVSQMTRYLSQLLRRVFVFHQCPFHTRAHPWDFALFAFTTFTERDPKNVGVFLENVQRFSFFLRRFLKNVGRFYGLLPTFLKVGCSLKIMGCCESHFFLFSVEKMPLFSTRVWRLWKQKNANPRERARVSRAREKRWFFLKVKSYPLQVCFTDGKMVTDFSSLSRIL